MQTKQKRRKKRNTTKYVSEEKNAQNKDVNGFKQDFSSYFLLFFHPKYSIITHALS